MSNSVPNEGTAYAPILLIGEAPGHWEHVYGRPFVGPSYTDKLLPWWKSCTPPLSRDMFFITNVLDYQPERIDTVSEIEMRAAFERLHDVITNHNGPDGAGPVIIVPTGNYALYALTGKGRISFHSRDGKHLRPGITDWRGSILSYSDKKGRPIKVIPTIHPAAAMVFRTPGYDWVCQKDWQRIAEDVAFRELRLPPQTHMIAPTKAEVREYINWTRSEAEKRKNGKACFERIAASLDVETPKKIEYAVKQTESASTTAKCGRCAHTKRWHLQTADSPELLAAHCSRKAAKKDGGTQCSCEDFVAPYNKPKRVKTAEYPYLGCIGYAWDEALSMTVPTTLAYWHDETELADVLRMLAEFHNDPNIDFFGQNFGFDAWWCAVERLPLHSMRWDLMKMHRVRVPFSDWHDLAFQASLYTRQPYWKDEAKDPDSISKYAHNNEALWEYNGIDNCTQRALLPLHIKALEQMGRLEYYDELEASVDAPLLELSLTGIRADLEGRAKKFAEVSEQRNALSKQINDAAGMPIITTSKKGIITGKVASPAKLKVFLYELLRLPPQYTKNQKKQKVISTDVVTLRRLMDRFPGESRLQAVGPLVLQQRRLNTIANFVKEEGVSADGRVYGFFKQDTVLGRLSCSHTPKHEGRNIQNIDREIRKLFVADRGDE